MTSGDFPELLTVEQVGKLFNISKSSVYRLVEGRVLPFYKISAGLRFDKKDLLEYLERQKVKPIDEWFYKDKKKSHKKNDETKYADT